MKTKIKASVIGIAVLLVLIAAVSAVNATVIKVVPANQTVFAGENFVINIAIEDVTNMKSDQARLYFDPSAKNATEIIEGDFLKTGGSTLGFPIINNAEGFAGFAYTLLPGGTPVTGSGVLATVNFTTSEEAEGTFNLYLAEVKINTTAGKVPVDVYNGTVKILAPTPTPTSTGGDASSGGGGGGEAPTDTDGGGIDDGAEIIRGTDPLDPTDDIVSTPMPSPPPQVTPTLSPAVTPPPTPSPSPTPTPPGFEAFFAIASLLAVTYLVMRRRNA